MSTKKKVAAKAAVKAPVRRIKPGPAARRKMREARAAALYPEPQSAAFPAGSYKNDRVAADLTASNRSAGNLSAAISGRVLMSPAEVEHEQKLANVRLVNAQAEAQEIANQRERGDRSGAVHFNFSGECAADLPKVGQSLATEQEAFDVCQLHTSDLVPRLAARLDQVLKSAPVGGADGDGRPRGEVRHRSSLADWVGLRTARQADINQALMDLLDRLDIG